MIESGSLHQKPKRTDKLEQVLATSTESSRAAGNINERPEPCSKGGLLKSLNERRDARRGAKV